MAYRKTVEIKTRCRSLATCMDSCRDIEKKRTLLIPASGKIYGEVFEDGSFVLSSRGAKTSVIFEYVGHMEERDDGLRRFSYSGSLDLSAFYVEKRQPL